MPAPRPAPWNLALLVLGGLSIVVGGLVAAVTGPFDLSAGSWVAAYLVLVGGVASIVIGAAQAWLVSTPLSPRGGWPQVGSWVVGNAAVLLGTLVRLPWAVTLGGLLLVVVLVIAVLAARRPVHALLGWAYRGILLIVLVSIPVGLMLSFLRAG